MTVRVGGKERAFIGTSGWSYRSWRGDFYPPGLRQREELGYLARRTTSLELNGSFYSLQHARSWRAWRDAVPEDFVLAVKGSRYLTHMRRLREPQAGLANFLASGVLALGDRLGPLLWQLPERVAFDADVLDAFLTALPRTHGDAGRLAADHDERVSDPVLTPVADPSTPVRHALEPRSPTFRDPEAIRLLSSHGIATVWSDSAGRWPELDEDTADFRYVRLHGHTELYASGYATRTLRLWAERVDRWSRQGQAVHVYFDNDARGRAPHDAVRLLELLED